MKTEFKYLLLITVIFIAACIETDIYLPAFPDMMTFFSRSEGAIQSLLTWNFVGICISGPLYGPLSDSLGRKKPLFAALTLFFVGSLITLFANHFSVMLLGRILQGLGSGGCFTLGTAIIFDIFQKERAIYALNRLNLIIPVIMAGAPLAGGYLNHTFGFRSNFLAIALCVLLSLLICFLFFEETLPKEKQLPFRTSAILKDFKKAFLCLPFWQVTLIMCLIFASYIAFLSISSVLFILEFKMNKLIFPFVQASVLGGWVLGSLTLNRSLSRLGSQKIKKIGVILTALSGLTTVCFALIAPTNPYLLTLGMTVYAFGANWVIGLYFPEGMELLPEIKGITASLMTSVRLFSAAAVVSLLGIFYNATVYPLALILFLTIFIVLPTLFFYEQRRSISIKLTDS